MDDLGRLHRTASDDFSTTVEGIEDTSWGDPTPCTEWDVRRLLGHNVYENLWVPSIMAGMTIEEVGDRFEHGVLGDDPKGAWAATVEPACVSVEEPGALERTVHLSFGDMPGGEYVKQRIVDLVVHRWDLARGAGLPDQLDPSLVTACLAWGEAWRPMLEAASDFFAPPIDPPSGADEQTRMLNLFGRRP